MLIVANIDFIPSQTYKRIIQTIGTIRILILGGQTPMFSNSFKRILQISTITFRSSSAGEQILFRQINIYILFTLFNKFWLRIGSGRKCPARTTLPLILNRSYNAFLSPIELQWLSNFAGFRVSFLNLLIRDI